MASVKPRRAVGLPTRRLLSSSLARSFIFYAHRTHVLAGITPSTGLSNIPASYPFIRWNEPVGAAQRATFSFFITYAVTAKYSARVHGGAPVNGREI